MKISVTGDLAKKIILDHFGLSGEIEVKIQTDNKSNENTQLELLARANRALFN